jgi:hypothetical protein
MPLNKVWPKNHSGMVKAKKEIDRRDLDRARQGRQNLVPGPKRKAI